ncbi:MAG: hypothetical protein Q4B63_10490 [Clostridium perfringens]|nr:hypothetical protein [Clostridium perfringens]
MHLKIIFIGLDEKIIFDKGILEKVDDGYKKLYYKLNNDTVEVLFFNENYYGISRFICNRSIVVINESKSLRAEEIQSIKNNKEIVTILLNRNNKMLNFEKEFVFPYLSKNKKVKICDIILTIYNICEYDSIIKNTSGIRGIIGFTEKEELQQDLLLDVLSEFEVIEKCKEYSLNLFLKEELNVEELAYIEDPIGEYTYKNSSLKIKQNIDEIYKEKIYFCMMGIQ